MKKIKKEKAGKFLTIYQQIITPESAEQGDFESSREWDEIECEDVEDAVERIRNEYGYVEASSSQFHPNIWYSTTDPSHDNDYYKKGMEKYYTIHPKGFSKKEEEEIYKGLFPKLKSNPEMSHRSGKQLHWKEYKSLLGTYIYLEQPVHPFHNVKIQ